MKKLIAVLLCAVMLLSMAACSNTAVKDNTTDETDTAAADETADTVTADEAEEENAEMKKLSTAFDKDEVMLTVGGIEYTWELYFYLLNYYVNYLAYYNSGTVYSLADTLESGQTAAEFIQSAAYSWIIYDSAIRINAEKQGISLTDEEIAEIEEEEAATIEDYGGKEYFDESLEENYCTMELFRYLEVSTKLADKCFNTKYGEMGSKLTDEELAAAIEGDTYMMAKHILIKTTNTDDEGNETEMTDDEKKAVYDQMAAVKAELDTCTKETIEAKFDEYMNSLSEDSGLLYYPDGYLFQSGDMVTEFEEATQAIGEYECSDIVETSYGYHLILRLPINYDEVPQQYSSYSLGGDEEYTLRYITAMNTFDSEISQWEQELTPESSDAYAGIDIIALSK